MLSRSFLCRPALWLLMLGIILMLPSLLWGPGATHSHFYNILWTEHFGQQIAAGHPYQRWLPHSFEGIGSPTFYFYPPLVYLMSGSLNAAGFTALQSINLSALLMLSASGFSMHAFLSARGTRPLLGAALYMIAPYHLYDFYVRGALAEFGAFVWLPMIALAIDRLPTRRGVGLLAFACTGLVLTHLPAALLTGLFMIAPLTIWRIAQDRATLPAAALAGLIALGLAAFYLLPAMTLQNEISTNVLWTPRFSATAWSIWREDGLVFTAIALGTVLLAWPARSVWTGIAVFAALASVGLVPFLWEVDLLNKVQFPWRLLCVAEFATIVALMQCRPRPVPMTAAVLSLALAYVILIGVGHAMLLARPDYARLARTAPDAPEYLPRGIDPTLVSSFDRSVDLSAIRALPRGDEIVVQNAGPVTLGRAAFPIWRVTRDGRPVVTTGPLLHFQATPGRYQVERVLIWQEIAGTMISLFTVLLIAAEGLYRRLKVRRPPRLTRYASAHS
jgi:hypothetical protein